MKIVSILLLIFMPYIYFIQEFSSFDLITKVIFIISICFCSLFWLIFFIIESRVSKKRLYDNLKR